MVQIVDGAFGDGKNKGTQASPPNQAADMTKGAPKFEDAMANVNKMLKF